MSPRGLRGQHSMGPRGSRVNILWVRGGRGVCKKNIKEIFFKISEKNILLFFLYWKFLVFLEKIWSTLDVFAKAEHKKNNTKNLKLLLLILVLKLKYMKFFGKR